MRTVAAALAGLMLAGAAFGAPVHEAARPQWAPGDYWAYRADDGTTLSYWTLAVRPIRGEDHHVLLEVERNGDETATALAFAPVRAPFPRGTNTPAPQSYLDFPLFAGKAWVVREAASAGFLSAPRITAEVVGLDQVETGFGTFDAFEIRYEREDRAWRLWYAPAVRSWVRQTSPVDGAATALAEAWRFPADYALNQAFAVLEGQLGEGGLRLRGLLNDLIQLGIAPERAEALKARL